MAAHSRRCTMMKNHFLLIILLLASCNRDSIIRTGAIHTEGIQTVYDPCKGRATFRVTGNVIEGDQFSELGFCWGNGPAPHPDRDSSLAVYSWNELSEFSGLLPDLHSDTTYYFRAWGRENGALRLGQVIQFRTSGFAIEEFSLIEIPDSGLFLQGVIHRIGQVQIVQAGSKWSQSSTDPIISGFDQRANLFESDTFALLVSNWDPSLPFYHSCYAIDNQGIMQFSSILTKGVKHDVKTGGVFLHEPDGNSAMNLTSSIFGFARPFEFGHCWSSEDLLPTLRDQVIIHGVSLGDTSFSSSFDDKFSPRETYSIRAFSRPLYFNGPVFYGERHNFSTSDIWLRRKAFLSSFFPRNILVWDRKALVTSTQDLYIFDPFTYIIFDIIRYPGSGSNDALHKFILGSKIFVGGNSYSNSPQGRFWCYNLLTKNWETVAPFPDSSPIAFATSSGNQVFVGTQNDSTEYLKTIWAYRSRSNTWGQLDDFPGTLRDPWFSIIHESKLYIGLSTLESGSDFWCYNTKRLQWTKMADFPVNGYSYPEVFKYKDRIFAIGFGENYKEVWSYSPGEDKWLRHNDLPFGYYGGSVFKCEGKIFCMKYLHDPFPPVQSIKNWEIWEYWPPY